MLAMPFQAMHYTSCLLELVGALRSPKQQQQKAMEEV
jgi:hypothetical protein